MPVYEFECSKGTVTEQIVSMGTKSIKCPCCSKRAKKILSLCSFDLKGGGWYADGYASKGASGSKSTTTSNPAPKAPADSKSSNNGGSKSKSTSTSD